MVTASAASLFVTPNNDLRRGLAPSSPGTESVDGSGCGACLDDEASAAQVDAGAALAVAPR